MATTVFPSLNVDALALVMGLIIVGGFLGVGVFMALPAQRSKRLSKRRVATGGREHKVRRETWRMPQLALLERPVWSRSRIMAMWTLRLYLVAAVLLLIVKAVQIGTAH
jgi:hypothetical protein